MTAKNLSLNKFFQSKPNLSVPKWNGISVNKREIGFSLYFKLSPLNSSINFLLWFKNLSWGQGKIARDKGKGYEFVNITIFFFKSKKLSHSFFWGKPLEHHRMIKFYSELKKIFPSHFLFHILKSEIYFYFTSEDTLYGERSE